MSTKFDRRKFIQGATALGGVAAISAASSGAVVGSNERVRIGVIGVGNRGDQLIDSFQTQKDAQIVAVCDVYEPYLHAASAKVGSQVRIYHDYRKLLEQKDIDAVVVATPDHWHALQCIDACRSGKDVYVEKPVSLTVAEGRKMVEVAEQTKRVVQVGLQRRTSKYIQEAVQRIREGEIGKVTVVRCFSLGNESPMGIGNPPDGDPPQGLNWDLWLGPAPKVPYNPNRCLYKFRWFQDYSGGQITNQGTHFLDVIQWALGQDAPQAVFAAGGKFAVNDNREIPDTMEAIWQYAGPALVMFSQHDANGSAANRRGWDIEFQGTLGTLGIDSRGYEIVPESVRLQEVPALSPIDRQGNLVQGRAVRLARAPAKVPGFVDIDGHVRNFLDCVKSRQSTNCPIEVGHRSSTATLLANVALRSGRQVHWDAAREQVTNDEKSNELLFYKYRAPWNLT